MKNDFLTWREWFYMKKGIIRWFLRTLFNKSKFTNWEINGVVRIKPRKKGKLISGLVIREGGQVIIE